jgi:hypothetical protein
MGTDQVTVEEAGTRMRDTQAWVEAWVDQLETMGLSALALSLLETAYAFGFLISQTILVAQPVLSGIVSDARIEQATNLLNDPEQLDRVRQQLKKKEG